MMRIERLRVCWIWDNKYPFCLKDTVEGGIYCLPIEWLDNEWVWRDISKRPGMPTWIRLLYKCMLFCWGCVELPKV